jgi:hypothetical protein
MRLYGIFKTSCPSGWTRQSAWDNKFLRGASTYGGTGGTDTHTHTINIGNTTTTVCDEFMVRDYIVSGETWVNTCLKHSHTYDPPNMTTGAGDSLPTYTNVVYCYQEV